MKIIFFTFLICYFTFVSKAQFAVTANGAGAIPVGQFSQTTKFAYGGGMGLHYFFQDQGSIGLNVDYLSFVGQSLVAGIDYPNTNIIAVTPTMLFSFFMDNSPYLIIDAGGYFSTSSGFSSSAYGGAVGLGYLYGITDVIAFNINAKYTAAYNFDSKSVTMFAPVNMGLMFILGGTGNSKFR
jgi:hypothetical protein